MTAMRDQRPQYEPRTYRERVSGGDLVSFEVAIGETELLVRAERELREQATRSVRRHRAALERYIEEHPGFLEAMEPVAPAPGAPEVVAQMCAAGAAAGVGPMAAVAGAIAQLVGRDLLEHSREVIVENGGDVFLAGARERTVAIYAGSSPFSGKLGLKVAGELLPLGVCTSSGTVGHSRSLGQADAVVVACPDAALADALATALGNVVRGPEDVERALDVARSHEEVVAAVIIAGERLGAWGKLELVPVGWADF